MKVVLTGGSGFLGHALAGVYRSRGDEVVSVCRGLASEAAGPKVVRGELGKPLPDGAFDGATVVLHLAHDMRPGQEQRNVDGTRLWFDQAAREGVPRQVYFSSVSAHPRSPSGYGRAKSAMESYAIAHGGGVIRPGLVVGNGGVFASLVTASCRGPLAPALGGAQVRVFLTGLKDLLDVVTGGPDPGPGRISNLFAPEPVSMMDLVTGIRRFFGCHGLVVPIPAPIVRWGLTVAGPFHPALARYRESFLALVESQAYGYASSLASLGVAGRPLEAMLEQAFERRRAR